MIQDNIRDEASPWLKRTGWTKYLENCDHNDLLPSISEPYVDEGDDDEPIEGVIWRATDEVVIWNPVSRKRSARNAEFTIPESYQKSGMVLHHFILKIRILLRIIRAKSRRSPSNTTYSNEVLGRLY